MKLNDMADILCWLSQPWNFSFETAHTLPLTSTYPENPSKLVALLCYKSDFSETKLFPEFIVNKLRRKLFFQQNDIVPAENECTGSNWRFRREEIQFQIITNCYYPLYHLIQPSWKNFYFSTFSIFTLYIANFYIICICKESKQQNPSKTESVTIHIFNI